MLMTVTSVVVFPVSSSSRRPADVLCRRRPKGRGALLVGYGLPPAFHAVACIAIACRRRVAIARLANPRGGRTPTSFATLTSAFSSLVGLSSMELTINPGEIACFIYSPAKLPLPMAVPAFLASARRLEAVACCDCWLLACELAVCALLAAPTSELIRPFGTGVTLGVAAAPMLSTHVWVHLQRPR